MHAIRLTMNELSSHRPATSASKGRPQSMDRWLRQLALRPSVAGGFLATLVTPSGRLRRPNWLRQFVAARLNAPTRGFSERQVFDSVLIYQLVTGASVA